MNGAFFWMNGADFSLPLDAQRAEDGLGTRGCSQLDGHSDEVQPEVESALIATDEIAPDEQVAVGGDFDAVVRFAAEAVDR